MQKEELRIDKELDIRGEVCPFTFVKSKLVLEKMEIGETLRVLIDYEPSAHNVPKSMRDEGQEVLAVNRIDSNQWEIIIRKKK